MDRFKTYDDVQRIIQEAKLRGEKPIDLKKEYEEDLDRYTHMSDKDFKDLLDKM